MQGATMQMASTAMGWRRQPAGRRTEGFSMLELIVVMAIVAADALILLPKVNGLYAEYQLMSASTQLDADLIRARMEAIGENRYVRIRVTSNTQYIREKSSDGATWAADDVVSQLPGGVTTTTTTAKVQFDQKGYIYNSVNNTIGLRNTLSQQKNLSTSLIGQVTIS
jgi:prepilin-type N-terminal cleavage/methylation domain-containing protein